MRISSYESQRVASCRNILPVASSSPSVWAMSLALLLSLAGFVDPLQTSYFSQYKGLQDLLNLTPAGLALRGVFIGTAMSLMLAFLVALTAGSASHDPARRTMYNQIARYCFVTVAILGLQVTGVLFDRWGAHTAMDGPRLPLALGFTLLMSYDQVNSMLVYYKAAVIVAGEQVAADCFRVPAGYVALRAAMVFTIRVLLRLYPSLATVGAAGTLIAVCIPAMAYSLRPVWRCIRVCLGQQSLVLMGAGMLLIRCMLELLELALVLGGISMETMLGAYCIQLVLSTAVQTAVAVVASASKDYSALAQAREQALQAQLTWKSEQLSKHEGANTSRQRFMRFIFHEIRVPFNSLAIGLSLLDDDEKQRLSPEGQATLDMLLKASGAARTLLNDVLDFAKVESGAFKILLVPTALRELVDSTLLSMTPMACGLDLRVSLHCNIAPEVPACVLADKVRLQQVVANLVSNAIKFAPHDGTGRVELSIAVLPESALHAVAGDCLLFVGPQGPGKEGEPAPPGSTSHTLQVLQRVQWKASTVHSSVRTMDSIGSPADPSPSPLGPTTCSVKYGPVMTTGGSSVFFLPPAQHAIAPQSGSTVVPIQERGAGQLSTVFPTPPVRSIGLGTPPASSQSQSSEPGGQASSSSTYFLARMRAGARGKQSAAVEPSPVAAVHTVCEVEDRAVSELTLPPHVLCPALAIATSNSNITCPLPHIAPPLVTEEDKDRIAEDGYDLSPRGLTPTTSPCPCLACATGGGQESHLCTLMLTVRDNGDGIGLQESGMLFEAFRQLDAGMQYKGKGTGLGLAICHEIVSLHGGAVGVRSTGIKGQGAEFVVLLRLPVLSCLDRSDRDRLSPILTVPETHPPASPDPVSLSISSLPPLRLQTLEEEAFQPVGPHPASSLRPVIATAAGEGPGSPSPTLCVAAPPGMALPVLTFVWSVDSNSSSTACRAKEGSRGLSLSPTRQQRLQDSLMLKAASAAVTGAQLDNRNSLALDSNSTPWASPRRPGSKYGSKDRAPTIGSLAHSASAAFAESPLKPRPGSADTMTLFTPSLRAVPVLRGHASDVPVPHHMCDGTTLAAAHTRPLRILVVDDVTENRRLLARLLASRLKKAFAGTAPVPHPYHHGVWLDMSRLDIQEAADGHIALAMMHGVHVSEVEAALAVCGQDKRAFRMPTKCAALFDAVTMDAEMPIMSGFDTTHALRAVGYLGPIFGCTGNSLPEDQRYFLQCGVSVVFVKPVAVDELVSSMAAAFVRGPSDARLQAS